MLFIPENYLSTFIKKVFQKGKLIHKNIAIVGSIAMQFKKMIII